MDNYSFLLEINNCLGFSFTGNEKIAGEISGLQYEIFFIDEVSLFARTRVRLFGDVPFRDHIETAYREMQSFESFSIAEDIINLHAKTVSLSEDKAFAIAEELTVFSGKLSSLGYKDSTPAKEITERFAEAGNAFRQEAEPSVVLREERSDGALPRRIGSGIFGAVAGAALTMVIWILLSMLNYMTPYIIGAVFVVAVPVIAYEKLSDSRTSAVQIGISLFFSIFALLLGERLIWTFTLLRWYSNITFSRAYFEVPYMVKDGIVSTNDYYQDYIIIIAAVVLFYIVVFWNYIKGGLTISDLMKKRR